jgi:hypothetical protein
MKENPAVLSFWGSWEIIRIWQCNWNFW